MPSWMKRDGRSDLKVFLFIISSNNVIITPKRRDRLNHSRDK